MHLEYSYPVILAVMSEVETGYTHAQVPHVRAQDAVLPLMCLYDRLV